MCHNARLYQKKADRHTLDRGQMKTRLLATNDFNEGSRRKCCLVRVFSIRSAGFLQRGGPRGERSTWIDAYNNWLPLFSSLLCLSWTHNADLCQLACVALVAWTLAYFCSSGQDVPAGGRGILKYNLTNKNHFQGRTATESCREGNVAVPPSFEICS